MGPNSCKLDYSNKGMFVRKSYIYDESNDERNNDKFKKKHFKNLPKIIFRPKFKLIYFK